MSGDYFDPYRKRICHKCKKKVGIHELNFGVWECANCYQERRRDQMAPHTNWAQKETVDSLMEAVYYFNYTKRENIYKSIFLGQAIKGDKGIVAYTIDQDFDRTDPFGQPWPRSCRYYVLYNRRYLYHGDSIFERASMYKGDWQTVRKDVLEQAANLNEERGSKFKGNVAITIVMRDKTVWFINPSLMRTFCFEYEAERIPYNEASPECSIPISKEKIISRHDPFSTHPTKQIQ